MSSGAWDADGTVVLWLRTRCTFWKSDSKWGHDSPVRLYDQLDQSNCWRRLTQCSARVTSSSLLVVRDHTALRLLISAAVHPDWLTALRASLPPHLISPLPHKPAGGLQHHASILISILFYLPYTPADTLGSSRPGINQISKFPTADMMVSPCNVIMSRALSLSLTLLLTANFISLQFRALVSEGSRCKCSWQGMFQQIQTGFFKLNVLIEC